MIAPREAVFRLKTKMAVIYGAEGPDTKNGTAENDTIYGWANGGNANSVSGSDTLNGAAGNDNLFGGTSNDSLLGDIGNDTLDGGLGSDIFNGGAGNDTYIIDNISDLVREAASSGTDTVRSFISHTLGANLENLTLTGTSAINGTGNTINNRITGNAANNTLNGAAGSDALNGGLGIDTLIGGTGNDTYVIETSSDLITENSGEGTDTVQSSVNYTLDNNLENLTLTGPNASYGTGNSRDNILNGGENPDSLTGLDGNDSLYGGGGNGYDTLNGGTGDDTLDSGDVNRSDIASYFNATAAVTVNLSTGTASGGDGNDILLNISQVWGSDFNDTLIGSASGVNIFNGYGGNDSLSGGASIDYFLGGAGDDSLFGDAYNDFLSGDAGNDTLTGGAGADSFEYRNPAEGIDTITDFSVVDDTISVRSFSTYYFGGGLTSGAAITTDQFVLGSSAVDASDRFIYDQNTGALFFDEDGTGTSEQVQFATLSTGLALTNADISVV